MILECLHKLLVKLLLVLMTLSLFYILSIFFFIYFLLCVSDTLSVCLSIIKSRMRMTLLIGLQMKFTPTHIHTQARDSMPKKKQDFFSLYIFFRYFNIQRYYKYGKKVYSSYIHEEY